MKRRTAAAVVMVSALAGGGTAWAVTHDDDRDTAGSAAATPTPSKSPTPSAGASNGTGGSGSGSASGSATGSLTVRITTPSGENPFDARFVVIDATSGQEVGPENGTLADVNSQSATLTGIPPGTYVVTAGSDDDRWRAAYYGPPSADYDRANATPLSIRAGQSASITITLREFPNGEPPQDDDGEDSPADPVDPTPTPTPTASPASDGDL